MTETGDDIAIYLDNASEIIDLRDFFPRAAPLQVEIGSGKGTFLLNQSHKCPQTNFLGIEWSYKYYRYSVERLRRRQVPNVRILRADARDVISHCLADESVSGFHVYFPDPWPKRRHHKRRFFQPDYVKQLARCLVKGGQLRTATDHAEYFAVIREVLLQQSNTGEFFEQIDFFPAAAAEPGEWVGSNFERKYLKEGRDIYTLAVSRL